MNLLSLRQSLLGLTFLFGIGSQAMALGHRNLIATTYAPYAETVYGVPTSYLVPTTYAATTSYLSPTSYIYPTAAYLYPTSYTPSSYIVSPTSYVVPTYYRATSYVVPRRYVARPIYSTSLTYVPTSYTPMVSAAASYYPTVIETPVVSSPSICCNDAATVTTQAPSTTSVPQSSPDPGNSERKPSSVVESVPSNVPAYRPEEQAPSAAPGNNDRPAEPPPSAPTDSGTPMPPVSPAPPERETSTAPPPTTYDGPPPPAAETATATDPAATTFLRQARKPVNPGTRPMVRPASLRNILEGKVVSSESQQGEEGVRVILSSRAGNFVDKVATTDAFGHYAVRLPDGDWTVKVAMPSGKVYPVSQLTVSAGQITDSYGQDIPSLTINR